MNILREDIIVSALHSNMTSSLLGLPLIGAV